jgi:4'-phosphopantetheinyl transferase
MNLRHHIRRHSAGQPPLKDGEIHVWRVDLNQEASGVQKLFETLSPDEKQKAERYRFEKDRNHFAAARGSLRKILGVYLGVSPDQIRFSYNRYGKPFLNTENQRIRFNVSHSHGVALVAVTRGREIGIDIEFINDDLAVLKTAEKVFSPAETSMLKNLSPNLQTAAFFSVWTRKEALLKAIGEGFSYSPKQFTVSAAERETLSFTNNFQTARNWSLTTLPAAPDYAAALAVEGNLGTICFWQ